MCPRFLTYNPFPKIVATHSPVDDLLDGIASRLSSSFGDAAIAFIDSADLLKQLKHYFKDNGPIAWLEIVDHGTVYRCGDVRDGGPFARALNDYMDASSKVYLSGCNTGLCVADKPIAQQMANEFVGTVYGAMGYLDGGTLVESGSAFEVGCSAVGFLVNRGPRLGSLHLRGSISPTSHIPSGCTVTSGEICARDASGICSFNSFSKDLSRENASTSAQESIFTLDSLTKTSQRALLKLLEKIDRVKSRPKTVRLAADFSIAVGKLHVDFYGNGQAAGYEGKYVQMPESELQEELRRSLFPKTH